MSTAALAMLLVLLAALGLLSWRLARLQALLRTLSEDQRQLAAAWNALPPEARGLLPARDALLSIEILNPSELAAQESPLGGVASRLTPRLIRGIVYQRTADMLRAELPKYGVRAEVRVHGLA